MRIIEMCPICGHNLLDSVIAVMPPISLKECPHCGWMWEGKPQEIIRVPFGGTAQINLEELATITIPAVPDSESIAGLLDDFEYHPDRKAEILKKYESVLNS